MRTIQGIEIVNMMQGTGEVVAEGRHRRPGRVHQTTARTRRRHIFGQDFVDQVKAMGIRPVLSTPRSPWQRAYVERVIGTLRRECLDHVIVFNERSLYRNFHGICGLLSSEPNPPRTAEGHPGASPDPVSGSRAGLFDSRGR